MEYKASLDTTSKIITIGVIIIFLAIGYRNIKALITHADDWRVILIN
ncbi:MAG: hypothetical protein ACHQK8_07030 [Bacteroidia bacterium]